MKRSEATWLGETMMVARNRTSSFTRGADNIMLYSLCFEIESRLTGLQYHGTVALIALIAQGQYGRGYTGGAAAWRGVRHVLQGVGQYRQRAAVRVPAAGERAGLGGLVQKQVVFRVESVLG